MPSPSSLRCLHIVFPAALEETVCAALVEGQWSLPFTLLRSEGHSQDFVTVSTEERVRGRVARRVLLMVQPDDTIRAVIATLRARVRSKNVVWWTTRIEDFGRLT
ncbi:MAG: DUF3240 family protein [Zoogloeaceae bacterium]|jgi:hypothetical protein|nr:DUF3240 family protein [Zoogloeaceae bacterium]